VVVSGSHGGLSAARFALQALPHLAVFNDAGIGKDGAGIAALTWLQPHGIAAVTVAHDSARIGGAGAAAVAAGSGAQRIVIGTVTGPSLTRCTCMSAPNTPAATGACRARALASTASNS